MRFTKFNYGYTTRYKKCIFCGKKTGDFYSFENGYSLFTFFICPDCEKEKCLTLEIINNVKSSVNNIISKLNLKEEIKNRSKE